MTKNEYIAKVAENCGITKKEADKVISAFVDVLSEELVNGGSISVPALGTFKTAQREARETRNPKTGEKCMVPAKKVAKFKVSSVLSGKL